MKDADRHPAARHGVAELPARPSALIRLALKDLEAVESSPLYKVDMRYWGQSPSDLDNEPCTVGLAGAVMSVTLGTLRSVALLPSDFAKKFKLKLWAVNSFGRGQVSDGCKEMALVTGLDNQAPFDRFDVTPYRDDSTQFKIDMSKMADGLEAAGL